MERKVARNLERSERGDHRKTYEKYVKNSGFLNEVLPEEYKQNNERIFFLLSTITEYEDPVQPRYFHVNLGGKPRGFMITSGRGR